MENSKPEPISYEDMSAEAESRSSRPIGAYLRDAGWLTLDKTEKIYRLQQEDGSLFGEAAVKLGLISQEEIEQALSRQFDFKCLVPGKSKVSNEVIAAYYPDAPSIDTLRRLRGTLLSRHFNRNPDSRTLSLTSTHRSDGRSILTANLAVMISHMGRRTLLIDADFRNPRQHELFGVDNRRGLSSALIGRSLIDALEPIEGLNALTVLPAGIKPPNPQELLGRSMFPILLDELKRQFNVILIDTPASDMQGDALTVSACAGNALVVVRDNVTQVCSLKSLIADLCDAQVNIVGSVLIKF
jgi:protein-tyrosine kinase